MPEDVSIPGPTTWEVGQKVTIRHPGGNTITMPATDDGSMTDPQAYLDLDHGWELWQVEDYPEPLNSRLKGFRDGTLVVPISGMEI